MQLHFLHSYLVQQMDSIQCRQWCLNKRGVAIPIFFLYEAQVIFMYVEHRRGVDEIECRAQIGAHTCVHAYMPVNVYMYIGRFNQALSKGN